MQKQKLTIQTKAKYGICFLMSATMLTACGKSSSAGASADVKLSPACETYFNTLEELVKEQPQMQEGIDKSLLKAKQQWDDLDEEEKQKMDVLCGKFNDMMAKMAEIEQK